MTTGSASGTARAEVAGSTDTSRDASSIMAVARAVVRRAGVVVADMRISWTNSSRLLDVAFLW
jgi:hypothetical protein